MAHSAASQRARPPKPLASLRPLVMEPPLPARRALPKALEVHAETGRVGETRHLQEVMQNSGPAATTFQNRDAGALTARQ